MNLRKFALFVHIDGTGPIILGKTCRYCPACELIIAHQNELEAELQNLFSTRASKVVGKEYLVLGTVEIKAWTQGLERPLTFKHIREQTAGFKKYSTLSADSPGWKQNK